jgi:hypothetical protein
VDSEALGVRERDLAYGCRSSFEEEGGLGEPCLCGGEVGHCSVGVWVVLYSLEGEGYEVTELQSYSILMRA